MGNEYERTQLVDAVVNTHGWYSDVVDCHGDGGRETDEGGFFLQWMWMSDSRLGAALTAQSRGDSGPRRQ